MPNRKEGKWPRDFNALDKCLLRHLFRGQGTTSLRADEIKLWLTNQSLVIVCTQAKAQPVQPIVLKQNTKTLTPVLDLLFLFIFIFIIIIILRT